MYDSILLPTDGSPGMGSTIDQCVYQAAQSGATVHALYVVDIRSYVMLPDETSGQVARLLEGEGQEALEHVREVVEEQDLDVVTGIKVGVPHEEILKYAVENEIDLIVMGTHGRTGDQKRVVGSVAESVIRGADSPVLTVRMSEEERQEVVEELPEAQQRYIR